MPKDINDLKTVASFMLLSLAFSPIASAKVNENLIADAASFSVTNNILGVARALYGVPMNPSVNPPGGFVQVLYGVPTEPIQPLYGIPVQPVIPEPIQPLYGIPVEYEIVKPEIPSNELNTVPTKNSDKLKDAYNLPAKNTDIKPGLFGKNKDVKDSDSNTPVNYVAPVIIPGYVIDMGK